MTEFEQRIYDEVGSLDQKDDLTFMCLSVAPQAAAAPADAPTAVAAA